MQTYSASFTGVPERTDPFLALFPHRFDYIYAKHPAVRESPDWYTESRHPLSDRLIQQGAYLYGVRFGTRTNYCLLDIDIGSQYHPARDSLAIARITASLEAIGLVRYLCCTSSYSGGLHLYFPFQQTQNAWELASAVGTLLENAGFTIQPGQLEIFPNPKPYRADGTPSLFNAHRLPLQSGSYLLNSDFQAVWGDRNSFVRHWEAIQQQNQVETKTIKQILKQARRRLYHISGKADKFINDLNAEIELGWTGYGQTNRLLGRIAMRIYIFNHILVGGEPRRGQALINEIVATAQSLPGYREWCRHQHEITHRAEEWARCIENSHYFHYGDASGKFKAREKHTELKLAVEKSPTWNQQQSDATRDRIRNAIADLLEKEILPTRPTARFKALLGYGIGGGSLYRHRDLWHPDHLLANQSSLANQPSLANQSLEQSQPDNNLKPDSKACLEQPPNDQFNPQHLPSLLSIAGGDNASGQGSGDCAARINAEGGNNPIAAVASRFVSRASRQIRWVQRLLIPSQPESISSDDGPASQDASSQEDISATEQWATMPPRDLSSSLMRIKPPAIDMSPTDPLP